MNVQTRPWVVYQLTAPSGKRYTGKSCEFDKRMSTHASGKGGCVAIRNAIRCYGFPAFKVEIVWQGDTEEEANAMEQAHCFGPPCTYAPTGYNLAPAGGMSPSLMPGVAAKIGAAKRGKWFTAEHRAKIAAANRAAWITRRATA